MTGGPMVTVSTDSGEKFANDAGCPADRRVPAGRADPDVGGHHASAAQRADVLPARDACAGAGRATRRRVYPVLIVIVAGLGAVGLSACGSSAAQPAPSPTVTSSAPPSSSSSPPSSAASVGADGVVPGVPTPTSTATSRDVPVPAGLQPLHGAACDGPTELGALTAFLRDLLIVPTDDVVRDNLAGIARQEVPHLKQSISATAANYRAAGYPADYPVFSDLTALGRSLDQLAAIGARRDIAALPKLYVQMNSQAEQFADDGSASCLE